MAAGAQVAVGTDGELYALVVVYEFAASDPAQRTEEVELFRGSERDCQQLEYRLERAEKNGRPMTYQGKRADPPQLGVLHVWPLREDA